MKEKLLMLNAKKVIIMPKAQQEIDEILTNIIEYTGFESSGIRFYNALFDKIEAISYMPTAIGRLREDGTREAFVNRYRIVYKETNESIYIIAIIHSCRLYPQL